MYKKYSKTKIHKYFNKKTRKYKKQYGGVSNPLNSTNVSPKKLTLFQRFKQHVPKTTAVTKLVVKEIPKHVRAAVWGLGVFTKKAYKEEQYESTDISEINFIHNFLKLKGNMKTTKDVNMLIDDLLTYIETDNLKRDMIIYLNPYDDDDGANLDKKLEKHDKDTETILRNIYKANRSIVETYHNYKKKAETGENTNYKQTFIEKAKDLLQQQYKTEYDNYMAEKPIKDIEKLDNLENDENNINTKYETILNILKTQPETDQNTIKDDNYYVRYADYANKVQISLKNIDTSNIISLLRLRKYLRLLPSKITQIEINIYNILINDILPIITDLYFNNTYNQKYFKQFKNTYNEIMFILKYIDIHKTLFDVYIQQNHKLGLASYKLEKNNLIELEKLQYEKNKRRLEQLKKNVNIIEQSGDETIRLHNIMIVRDYLHLPPPQFTHTQSEIFKLLEKLPVNDDEDYQKIKNVLITTLRTQRDLDDKFTDSVKLRESRISLDENDDSVESVETVENNNSPPPIPNTPKPNI